MERRLAVILAADVVGYSKLMGEDEAGTLLALSRLIKETIDPLIGEHKGRVVKLMGDGILAEFGSVVDAVSCALAWQEQVGDKSDSLQFRIGINLGDVIIQDGEYLRQRRQCCGAAGRSGRTGRGLPVGYGLRRGEGQVQSGVRRFGRAERQEYC